MRHAGGVSDQPTTPLPLPGNADFPPAWSDRETRRSANRTLWIGVLLLLIGLAAAAACVALFVAARIGEPWGLPVVVIVGGLAGGTIAGGIATVAQWARLRRFLAGGPWISAELMLDHGKDAELIRGRTQEPIRLEVRTAALGDPGAIITVEVRSDGDEMLITAPPRRQLIRARNLT